MKLLIPMLLFVCTTSLAQTRDTIYKCSIPYERMCIIYDTESYKNVLIATYTSLGYKVDRLIIKGDLKRIKFLRRLKR